MVAVYLQVARSYLWRRMLWFPLAGTVGGVLLIQTPGVLSLLLSDDVPTSVATEGRPMINLIALLFYLWGGGLTLGAHLREQLSSARAGIIPHFRRVQRTVAAAWLGFALILPAMLVWAMLQAAPGGLEPLPIPFQLAMGLLLATLGLCNGFFMPWGALLVVCIPFVTVLPVAHKDLPPSTWPALISLCLGTLAWIWTRTPAERLPAVVGEKRGSDANRVELGSPATPGSLPGLLYRFAEPALERVQVLPAETLLARVRHRSLSIPRLSHAVVAVLGLALTWAMVVLGGMRKLELTPHLAERAPLILALVATLVVTSLGSWGVMWRPRHWLGYEAMRGGRRDRYALETLTLLAGHCLGAWLVAVVLPVMLAGLYLGRPLQTAALMVWLLGVYASITAMVLMDAMNRWLTRRWLDRGIELLNTLVFFGVTVALVSYERPLPGWTPLLWLVSPALVAWRFYVTLRDADLP